MNALYAASALLALVALGAPMRLPNVVYDKATDAPGPVRFDHRTHAERVANKCVSCHPQTFSILRPTRRASHAEMEASRSCGVCHDGKVAFGVQDAERCETCHDTGGGR
ncbi:MAG TPA: c(7)-type cytochrome triheme domain-containing protein [Vicinamibacteria bacterium]|nr:c(7)-type cytochrome triheme domain-containing protein [Vicinamibacteria bacterium]